MKLQEKSVASGVPENDIQRLSLQFGLKDECEFVEGDAESVNENSRSCDYP